jgi:hypothetical protein
MPSKLLILLFTILIALSFNVSEASAQFKKNNPKPGKYISWAHKNYGHKGFKLNRGQRNALGLSNGFLGTGIGANKNRNKIRKSSRTKK